MIKYLKIFIFSLLVVVQIAFAQGSDNPNEEKLVNTILLLIQMLIVKNS